MSIRRLLFLVTVSLLSFDGPAAGAMDGGSYLLGPGETQVVNIGSTDRTIRVCNSLGSAGDLRVAFDQGDPDVLKPGICRWSHGEQITLRNESAAPVFCMYQVVGKHEA